MEYMNDVARDWARIEQQANINASKEYGSGRETVICPKCNKHTCIYEWGYCAELGGFGWMECEACEYSWNSEEGDDV